MPVLTIEMCCVPTARAWASGSIDHSESVDGDCVGGSVVALQTLAAHVAAHGVVRADLLAVGRPVHATHRRGGTGIARGRRLAAAATRGEQTHRNQHRGCSGCNCEDSSVSRHARTLIWPRGGNARHNRGVPRDDSLHRRGGDRADARPSRRAPRPVGRGRFGDRRAPGRPGLRRGRRRPPPESHREGPRPRHHGGAPAPARGAATRRRDRARVGEGPRRGGALGARDLGRRRGEARAAARRSRYVPARQSDPGLAPLRNRSR